MVRSTPVFRDQTRLRDCNLAARDRVALRFGRDRAGATAVEFAMIAAPFLLLLMMIFQLALFQIAQTSLDDATRTVSRLAMTNRVESGNQSAEAFRNNLLCPALIFYMECENITVRAYKVSLTSDANQGTGIYQFVDKSAKTLRGPVSNSFCLGSGDDYVFLDVTYKVSSSISSLLQFLSSAGLSTMRSTSLFRNEPTSAAGAPC